MRQGSSKIQGWQILLAIAVVVILAAGTAVGFTYLANYKTNGHAAPASTGGAGIPGSSDAVLTLPVATAIWQDYQKSQTTQDADQFEAVTCASFIQADLQQRGLSTVPELLAAYQRAKKFVPVQDFADVVPTDAGGHKPAGTFTVQATVTDNRFVPPKTERRPIVYKMSFEDDHWTICPSINPV